MKTIRLIALALVALGAALLGQGHHTALADGEYGTLYIDVLPDVAGTGDSLPRSPIIIAAVTGLIAFGAGAFYTRRRWSR